MGRLLPPEISRSSWDVIKRNPLSAVDAFDYALLIYECFNGTFAPAEQATQARGVPSNMHQAFRRLLNSNPKARMSVANFLEQGRRIGGFFQTPLISLTEGIDKLGLMSEGERDAFFEYVMQSRFKNLSLTPIQPTRHSLFRVSRRVHATQDIARAAQIRGIWWRRPEGLQCMPTDRRKHIGGRVRSTNYTSSYTPLR